MSIRPEVQRLVDLGPFPASSDLEPEEVDHRLSLINQIARPVTQEEATALLTCFGPDDLFGVAWELLHLIETVPGDAPPNTKPDDSANEWVRRIWDRSHPYDDKVRVQPRRTLGTNRNN